MNKYFFVFITCFTLTMALYSEQPAIKPNFISSHAMSEEKNAVIQVNTFLLDNSLKQQSSTQILAGTRAEILNPVPRIGQDLKSQKYYAYYHINTKFGKGYVNSESLIYHYYNDTNQLTGIRFIPTYLPSLNEIHLFYQLSAYHKNGHFIVPLSSITNNLITKLIVNKISFKKIDWEFVANEKEFSQMALILQGKLYKEELSNNEISITSCEEAYQIQKKGLTKILTYETALLYPNSNDKFRYLKLKGAKTSSLSAIEKLQIRDNQAISYERTEIPSWSHSKLTFPLSAKVTSSLLRVRKEATTSSKQIAQLKKENIVTLLSMGINRAKVGDDYDFWYKIQIDGTYGYIYGAFLELLP